MSAIEFTEGDLLLRHELASRWATVGVSTKSPHALVREIADHYCVTYDEIMGKGRFAQVVRARQAVWLELRRLGWSYPQIGQFAGRDHTTVMAGVDHAKRLQPAEVVSGVPDRHVAGLGKDLAQDAGVGVEAEEAKGSSGHLAEDDGCQEGAAGGGRGDAAGEGGAGRVHESQYSPIEGACKGLTT